MKFVYFGYDFMLPAVERLLADGHQLLGIFTFDCDNIFNFNTRTLALAKKLKIRAVVEKPERAAIDQYIAQGCECFLAAGYPFKIPPIDKVYAINLHPSLLPKGRGLMPVPKIIIDEPKAAGFTIHKLSNQFDAGDILYQVPLPLAPRETVETLSARTILKAPAALSMIFADLPHYWKKAKPQKESQASTFPPPDDQMRLLDWNLPVEKIDALARAFGRYGSLAQFDNALWVVYAHDVWEEKHLLAPGTIAARLSREIVIAAKDGFVCLKEFQRAQ
jgi:methionyl-tRNA formyltransferase